MEFECTDLKVYNYKNCQDNTKLLLGKSDKCKLSININEKEGYSSIWKIYCECFEYIGNDSFDIITAMQGKRILPVEFVYHNKLYTGDTFLYHMGNIDLTLLSKSSIILKETPIVQIPTIINDNNFLSTNDFITTIKKLNLL